MTRAIIVTTAALALAAATPRAQDIKPEPAHKTTTVVGCLEAGGADKSTFKLTNVARHEAARAEASAPVPVGTSGQKQEYDVRVESGIDAAMKPIELVAHVGHKVEITARLPEAAPAAQPKPGAAAAVPVAPDEQRELLMATAVKHVSTSCVSQ
jgi:hypothetical protein